MSAEAAAAIIGAGVGVGLGFLAQLGVLLFTARNERRAAAQIIYAELSINAGEALAAIKVGEWPSPSGLPRRAAWEAYGVKLLRGRSVERPAHIASAYSRLDDLAWLAQHHNLATEDAHTEAIVAIRIGLYELGRLGGMTDPELEARQVLDENVRKERAELRERVASSRPNFWRRVWLRLRK